MAKKYFKSLIIEPTNICNLHCPACPVGCGYFNNKPRGSMSFQQFKRVIDLNKNFLEHVYLWGFGEPFLAPDIIKMINYTGENNIILSIHTNGNILNKKTMNQFKNINIFKLAITFSIDGLTQKTYSYYRKGGNLKKALDNLSYLINLKKKNNLSNLRIIWQFLIMRTNEHEIPAVYKLAKKMGVDKLKLKTINLDKDTPHYNNFLPQRYNKFLPKDKSNHWDSCEDCKVVKNLECEFINPGSSFVLWDGKVVPCCIDYQRRYLVGNAFKEKLIVIWNSEKYKKFRKAYKKNTNILCSRCRFKRKVEIYEKTLND